VKIGFIFVVIGLILGAIAAFVSWKLVYEPQSWPEVDAFVVSSTVINPQGGSYTPEFVFRYRADGVEHQTAVRSTTSSSSYSIAEGMTARFPAGSRAAIRVKPGEPEHIAYDARWSFENILIASIIGGLGALFAVIGLVVVLWRPSKPALGTDATTRSQGPTDAAVTPADPAKGVWWLAYIFGGIGVLLLAIAVVIVVYSQRGEEWPSVEAEVIGTSLVRTGTSRGQAMNDVSVRFRYTVDDRRYERETTTGMSSTSERAGLRAKFAPGTRHQIHYRPGNPNVIRFDTGSLFDRWFVPGILTLLGTIFTTIGVVIGRSMRRPAIGAGSFGADETTWN
jgi:hypothetical protein